MCHIPFIQSDYSKKPMHHIEKNLASVHQLISEAALAANRQSKDILLLAVSKTKPLSDIESAYSVGQRHFGESYLQEAEQKIIGASHNDLVWHFIGPIQSNKTRRISELFDWVHSVDRIKIAQRLDQFRPTDKPPLNILLQVNINQEASKAGILLDQIPDMAKQIALLNNVTLRGLMAIPKRHDDPAEQSKPFAMMQQALNQLQHNYPQCDTLSMGMSNDLKAAIAQGSTLVRIGTAIFGPRLT